MFISPLLLEKIYVKGSLQNNASGFEFKLKNVVDSGTLGGIKSLAVDGNEVPVSSISVKSTAGDRKAEEITFRTPLPLRYGAEATILVAGEPLAAGEHQLVLALSVVEIGKIEIKFKDEIS